MRWLLLVLPLVWGEQEATSVPQERWEEAVGASQRHEQFLPPPEGFLSPLASSPAFVSLGGFMDDHRRDRKIFGFREELPPVEGSRSTARRRVEEVKVVPTLQGEVLPPVITEARVGRQSKEGWYEQERPRMHRPPAQPRPAPRALYRPPPHQQHQQSQQHYRPAEVDPQYYSETPEHKPQYYSEVQSPQSQYYSGSPESQSQYLPTSHESEPQYFPAQTQSPQNPWKEELFNFKNDNGGNDFFSNFPVSNPELERAANDFAHSFESVKQSGAILNQPSGYPESYETPSYELAPNSIDRSQSTDRRPARQTIQTPSKLISIGRVTPVTSAQPQEETISKSKTTFSDIFKQSSKSPVMKKQALRTKPIKKASFMDIIKSPSTTTEMYKPMERKTNENLKQMERQKENRRIDEGRRMRRVEEPSSQEVAEAPMRMRRVEQPNYLKKAEEQPRGMRRIDENIERASEEANWREEEERRRWEEQESRARWEEAEARRRWEEEERNWREEQSRKEDVRRSYRPITARSIGDAQERVSHLPGPPPPLEQRNLEAAVAAGAAAYHADGHEEPKRLSFQIHGQDGPNSYRFGYDTGLGYNRQFRYEERDNYGVLHGRYGYYDQSGKLQIVNYSADPEKGFYAEGEHVPVPQYRR